MDGEFSLFFSPPNENEKLNKFICETMRHFDAHNTFTKVIEGNLYGG